MVTKNSMNTALFDNREDAERAVAALRDHGIAEDCISVLALSADGSGTTTDLDEKDNATAPGKDEGLTTTTAADAGKGAEEGVFIGAGLGLAAAVASIFLPGFGLIVGGGALATALSGALGMTVGGALAGGVMGFLVDQGMPEHAAKAYAEGLKRGGIIVSVHDTNDATPDEIHTLFEKYGGQERGTHPGGSGTTPADLLTTPPGVDASVPPTTGA